MHFKAFKCVENAFQRRFHEACFSQIESQIVLKTQKNLYLNQATPKFSYPRAAVCAAFERRR